MIVNKYISDVNDNTNITLDCFFENKIINFVKADIEGAEVKLVNGGQKILASQKDIKLLLATYHLKNAAEELKERLEKLEFTTEYSKGYMIVWWQNVEKETANPYIRRGVIRAKKV
ncbi:MAG: FkbM family methyltransferase [Chitinivibrionia bacterium]|nr:FkbM family methyltransferase [Chitinivibrionia bacterium]